MKKNYLLLLLSLMLSVSMSTQLKVLPNGWIHAGYNPDVFAPIIYMGTHPLWGYDNGKWGIEVLYGGLNFCKPWPSPNAGNYYLFLAENGRVGIGTYTPSYALDVNGDIATYGTLRISSDERLKTNIQPVSSQVGSLYKLNAKSYEKSLKPSNNERLTEMPEGGRYASTAGPDIKTPVNKEYGFLAQEFQKIFPELVKSDSSGYLSIDYISLIPIMVEAIKEQNKKIEELRLKLGLSGIGGIMKSPAADYAGNNGNDSPGNLPPSLRQNSPNPFSQSTQIKYYLPREVNQALLCIYDMNGRQIKQIALSERGGGSVTINGSELTAGIYLYALIADGKEVDVKRMILTE